MRRNLIVVAIPALMLLAGCAPDGPLRVGFIGGLSGRVADLGVAGRNGALLAIEQRNASGGINGRSVELSVRDDHQDPDVARAAMREFIALKVAAVVGPMTSSMAIAVTPLANEARIVIVSPTVTTNELAERDDYFLRVVARTREYARQHALHLRQERGLERVVAVYDTGNLAYTASWLADFREAFEGAGGRVLQTLAYQSGPDTKLSEVAAAALGVGGDGLLIVGNSFDTALLCQQIRKLDSHIAIAAAEWGGTERLLELGGGAVEGLSVGQFIDRDSKNPAYLAFRKAYLQRFGLEPGFAGLAAFDATSVVLDALAQAKPGPDLKARILATARYRGLQQDVVFDRYGDAKRPTYLTTIRQGRFVPAQP